MYRVYAPAPPLRSYIEQYWMVRSAPGETQTLEERIFVDARADIMFNFGVGYTRNALAGGGQTMMTAHLDAQREYPIQVALEGMIDLIGVRFRPGGLAAFVRMPLFEASNLTVDLADVFGAEVRELEGRLYDGDDDARVVLLNSFLLLRMIPTDSFRTTLFAASRIEAASGSIRIEAISQELGYSIRTVDRMFRHVFGFSPKFYARIVRCQNALAMLSTRPDISLVDIALTCGYYDQAHFTREFTDFVGSSPSSYRAMLSARQQDIPPNLMPILSAR